MSEYSSGPIQNTELIARFVFSPMFVHKKTGEILPGIFSHVFTHGCSVQRETKATNEELGGVLSDSLRRNQKNNWHSVLVAKCSDLRKITSGTTNQRSLCIYDTAEKNNIAHGEMNQSGYLDEADIVELRHELKQAFNNQYSPIQYRNGDIFKNIPIELHSQLVK